MTTSECPTCGRDDFKSETGMKVHHYQAHNQSIAPTQRCEYCGESFLESSSNVRFCSQECRSEGEDVSGENSNAWEGGTISEIVCEWCREKEEVDLSSSKGRFCSDDCRLEWWSEWSSKQTGKAHPNWEPDAHEEVMCENCEETFIREVRDIGTENYFCCNECRVEWWGEWTAENQRGENHPNWEDNDELYYGPKWDDVRLSTIIRDQSRCRICKRTPVNLQGGTRDITVHHIEPLKTFDSYEKANVQSNLVTLCRSCHRQVEGEDYEF